MAIWGRASGKAVILVVVAVSVAVAGLTAALAHILHRPVEYFTREPQVVLHGPTYTGDFSQLGGVVWFAAAGV
ncbi:MAG TPA: hypothetical protein VFJ78_08420, partial [Gaiellaceae bacterium]|nr:hypothetical protein [Gaiellaceae bacterium]